MPEHQLLHCIAACGQTLTRSVWLLGGRLWLWLLASRLLLLLLLWLLGGQLWL